jgi:hypothetical protein
LHSFANGQNRFKICSDKPMNPEHRQSNESGYYTWADVKNCKGFGVKFSMSLRGEADTGTRPSLLHPRL